MDMCRWRFCQYRSIGCTARTTVAENMEGGGPSGIENYLHMCADQRRRGCQSVTSVAFLPTMCRRRTVPGVGCS